MLPAGITKGNSQETTKVVQSLLKPSRIAMDGCIGTVQYQETMQLKPGKQHIITDSVSSRMDLFSFATIRIENKTLKDYPL